MPRSAKPPAVQFLRQVTLAANRLSDALADLSNAYESTLVEYRDIGSDVPQAFREFESLSSQELAEHLSGPFDAVVTSALELDALLENRPQTALDESDPNVSPVDPPLAVLRTLPDDVMAALADRDAWLLIDSDLCERIAKASKELRLVVERHRRGEDAEHMRAAMRKAISESSRCTSQSAPVYLGDARIEIDGDIIQLGYAEDKILSFLVSRGAASKSDLEDESPNALKTLRRIKKKFPQLSLHIILPGGKGRGGYRTTIEAGKDPI